MGERMKHYTMEEWIDFARGLVGNEAKSLMQRHLDTGCQECEKEAALWERVSRTAKREAAAEPPATAVRVAKAMMATSGYSTRFRRQKGSLAALLFDSLRLPLPVGVRSTAASSRQMLFGAGDHRIDLRMEPQLDSDKIAVIGQILDSANPERMLHKVPVTLHSGKNMKMVAASETNPHGEFQLVCKISESLELRARLPQGQQIRLALIELRSPAQTGPSYLIDSPDDIHARGERKKRVRKKV